MLLLGYKAHPSAGPERPPALGAAVCNRPPAQKIEVLHSSKDDCCCGSLGLGFSGEWRGTQGPSESESQS